MLAHHATAEASLSMSSKVRQSNFGRPRDVRAYEFLGPIAIVFAQCVQYRSVLFVGDLELVPGVAVAQAVGNSNARTSRPAEPSKGI
jgi:hypothetical protein